MKLLVIHGPNLNMLGSREPEIYGIDTLDTINQYLVEKADALNVQLDFYQSNHEGAIIDKIQAAACYDGIVINPAAFTHYSIALLDTLTATSIPAVEVHLSDLSKRESFRRHSVTERACIDQIYGYGKDSYVYGIEALIGHNIARLLKQEASTMTGSDAIYRRVVEILHKAFPKYDWTGIYLIDGDELVLHNFIGDPSPHERIPIGKGICGAAVAESKTIIVEDVQTDARYLACSPRTKSEIVVPFYSNNKCIGEIDIDSHQINAFHVHDRRYLEKIAHILGASLSGPE